MPPTTPHLHTPVIVTPTPRLRKLAGRRRFCSLIIMQDSLLALLRCPIDPRRQAVLNRDQQTLVCSGCQVRFPIKNGLPVLIPDEATLPEGTRSPDRLPCVHTRGG
jgi:uncharacterized protein YbaR (Trm112 family)